MREDMDKVLVERPRVGGHGARKGRPVRDPDLMRGFVGVHRLSREAGDFKHLNENLAPLRRYLARQINRPWNKVYSEIRSRIDAGNEVQAHVLTHIDQFLHSNVTKTAPGPDAPCGLVLQRRRWIGRFEKVRPGDLFVDPDDGIVKRARLRYFAPAAAKPEAMTRQRLGRDRLAVRIDGLWYGLDLLPFEIVEAPDRSGAARAVAQVGDRRLQEWTDPLLGPVSAHDAGKLAEIEEAYGRGLLALAKRQFSSRELRKLGLKNL